MIPMLLIGLLFQAPSAKAANGLAYERAGSGPAIVFIHGAFLNRSMWDREFALLEPRATVIRYDMRGHGESAIPSAPFSHAADVIALLDELKIQRATLVGLSSGAQTALDVALAAPDRVERLVLAGPGYSGYVPKTPPPGMAPLIEALKAGDYAKATEAAAAMPAYLVPPSQQSAVRAMLKANEGLWKVDVKLMQPPATPAAGRLESVKVPTLIVVGDRDMDAIKEQAATLAARIPGAKLVTIAGAGHLVNLWSPAEFGRALTDFLK
jgi:3-oxoadipate enol-lactonase